MKKWMILLVILCLFAIPVQATEFSAPQAPDMATDLMPGETADFGKDVWYIFKKAVGVIKPDIMEAISVCVSLIGILLIVSIVRCYTTCTDNTVRLISTICVSLLLIKPANSFIQLGVDTVNELCEYGKLLLPVMTSALAAEGGITTATGLYTGTILFNTLLSSGISKIMIPMIYIFLALAVADSATGESMLKNIKNFIKWLMTWSLKISLYIFTAYIGITEVVSGKVDANSVKVAKLALSGFVPVVGSVMSDASETILVSVGVMKNAAGLYGILAIIAICVIPFIKIGLHYLLLKLSGAVCGVLGDKASVKLVADFTSVMGLLLGMTGCVCLLHLVSAVCFMKGVG